MTNSQKEKKMEKLVDAANRSSGLLSFLSFIGLILFWVFGMQAGMTGLAADHVKNAEYQKEVVAVLGEIRDSLKDRGTDHILFDGKLQANTTQLHTNTVAVNKVSEAVVRISYALDGIEKSIRRAKK